jgi:hypothetical protein
MRDALTLFAAATFSFSLSHSACASLIELNTRPATGDIINWGQLGPPSPTVFPTPQNFTSTSGVGGTATLANNGNGAIYKQGGNFLGNFADGDLVFYTMRSGPLTLNFDTPLSTVGAQIDANTYGVFTAEIQAFDNNVPLGTFTEDGTVTTSNDNSAIFLGVADTTEDITSIVYSLTAAPGDLTDFAINQVSIVPVAATPLPGTLFASGLGLMGWLARRRKRKGLNSSSI